MDCSQPGFSVHGLLQARIPEWVAIPFSRGSTWPRDWTWVCGIAGRFPEPPGKPFLLYPEMSRSPPSDLPWCGTNSCCLLSVHVAWPVHSTRHRSRSLFTLHFTPLSPHIPLDPFRLPGGSQSVSLAQEDPLEKGMATHSGILAWRIPWTEEPGGYSPRVRKESDTTERLTLLLFHYGWFTKLCRFRLQQGDSATHAHTDMCVYIFFLFQILFLYVLVWCLVTKLCLTLLWPHGL